MSDLETMREMLKRAGVVFEEDDDLPIGIVPLRGVHSVIRITEGEGPVNFGYPTFFSELHFDSDGTLMGWGCWE